MAEDNPAINLLVAYALDLLAESERQHRAIVGTHAQLARFAVEAAFNNPTPVHRRECLDAVERRVVELLAVVGTQNAILAEMRQTVARLQEQAP